MVDALVLWSVALLATPRQDAPPEIVVLATLPDGIELSGREYVDPNGDKRTDRSRLCFDDVVTRVGYVGYRGAPTVAIAGDVVQGEFDYLEGAFVPPAPHPRRRACRVVDAAGCQAGEGWQLRARQAAVRRRRQAGREVG